MLKIYTTDINISHCYYLGYESGSALIYKGKLAGFATYGISCKDVPKPDIHTNTDNMREYLKDFTKD